MYTDQQAAALIAAVPAMMAESEALRALYVAPTMNQRCAISTVIWDFVARRGRKVYGGHALNAALLKVSPADAIYTSSSQGFPDVEFYSPDPASDVVEICRALSLAGHKYVQGKEAAHAGTFTVSVEFVRVCDVTYVPPNVYAFVPVVEYVEPPRVVEYVEPPRIVQMIEPSFSTVDYLRMLSDPFTSHWKLDKMIPRLMLVQRLFPLPFLMDDLSVPEHHRQEKNAIPGTKKNVDHVRAWFAARPGTVAVGQDALAYYETLAFGPPSDPESRKQQQHHHHVTVTSANFDGDVVDFALGFNEHVQRTRERHPLIDVVGRTATLYLSESTTVTIIDAMQRAVPAVAIDPATGMRVGSFAYVLLVSLGQKFAADVHRSESESKHHAAVSARLVTARTKFLLETGTTTVDRASPFRDVGLMYVGAPVSTMRKHMEDADRRRARVQKSRRMPHEREPQVWFTYDPSKPNSKSPAKYVYPVCDGSIVRNDERIL